MIALTTQKDEALIYIHDDYCKDIDEAQTEQILLEISELISSTYFDSCRIKNNLTI